MPVSSLPWVRNRSIAVSSHSVEKNAVIDVNLLSQVKNTAHPNVIRHHKDETRQRSLHCNKFLAFLHEGSMQRNFMTVIKRLPRSALLLCSDGQNCKTCGTR
jgi:hypothetical protein